jgi:hypothetical protein
VLGLLAMPDDILCDDDGRIHQHADGDGDAGEGHDVAGDAELLHQQERDQDGDGQRQRDDEDAAEVPEKNDVRERDEDELLQQRVLQRADGVVDQLAAVIEGLDRDAGRQAGRDLGDLFFDALDHRLGVFTRCA